MANSIHVDNKEVLLGLGEFKAAVADRNALLNICGEIMRTSVARTFRAQGSPAGSWPALALSTLKKKGYTTGHKLLILSGRLFGSIIYTVANGVLTIGTSLVYAAVHQYGSRDYLGGAAGPAQLHQMLALSRTARFRAGTFKRYGTDKRQDKAGRWRTKHVRAQGPADSGGYHEVGAHARRQNIPQRMFILFRPEDPGNMMLACETFLRGKAVRIGKIGGTAGAGGAA